MGIGLAVFDAEGNEKAAYEAGIHMLAGQTFDNETQKFWDEHRIERSRIEINCKMPHEVAQDVLSIFQKARAEHGKVTWISWPAASNWAMLYDLLDTYLPDGVPPEVNCEVLCISTMADMQQELRGLTNKPHRESYGTVCVGKHVPVMDALTYGFMFFAMSRCFRAYHETLEKYEEKHASREHELLQRVFAPGIGVTGKYGHGKDHFFERLREHAPVVRVAAGDELKRVCAALMPGAEFATQADKDVPITRDDVFDTWHAAYALCGFEFGHRLTDIPAQWALAHSVFEVEMAFSSVLERTRPRTRGELLQLVGTEIGRERIDPDLWMKLSERRIRELQARGVPWVVTDVRFENELEMVRRLGGVVLRVEAPALTPGTRDHAHPSETALDHVPLPTFVNDRSPAQNAALAEMCAGGVAHAIKRIGALEVRPSRFYNKQH